IRDFTYSPDAEWVFVGGNDCNNATILYRFPVADPLAIERLSPIGPDECFGLFDHWPSISPDGARLTFENLRWNGRDYSVRVMTIATAEVTEIVVGGQAPRWSPIADQIAYWNDNRIWVVKSDGTGPRAISPVGHKYVPGVNWSTDGQWILARFLPRDGWAGTTVVVLKVNTGEEIPLAWSTGYRSYGLPAWKPE
ncbi:MAG: hypothetical protein OEZ54_10255, partial [Gemmatimonadota bacterium]|nr:hypothetical protein [Gemmatimonadota bacterium]